MIADTTFYNGWQSFLHRFVTQTPLAATRQLSSPLAYTAVGGIPTVDFNLSNITFTAGMAKRAGTVFAGAPIVQGKIDGTGTGDNLTTANGALVSGYFYTLVDSYQGSISFWITPEWNGNDGLLHRLVYATAIAVYKAVDNKLYLNLYDGSNRQITIDVSGWTAGTMYHVVARWDKNKLDGTNQACVSINDVHTFGIPTFNGPTLGSPGISIGHVSGANSANAIIQGLTIYRRPLWDGTYGKDVGNGDEIAQIYNAGAGKDPCLVTGSWDVVLALPTNSTVGALVTGVGESWSHPHESELLTDWYYGNKFYNNPWSILSNASTTRINCGSDAALDDLHAGAMTVEGWFVYNGAGGQGAGNALMKGTTGGSTGWTISTNGSGIYGRVEYATASSCGSAYPVDNKWHHIAMTFDWGGDKRARLWLDGNLLGGQGGVASGAIGSDALTNLTIANSGTSVLRGWDGRVGWCRVSNSVRYSAAFAPSLTPPAPDANTVAQWNMSEGTGTTVDNAEGTASRDGTITAGTWTPEWRTIGTPTTPAADLATAEKIYNWGWKFTAAADLDGIKQTKTGQTAGADFVLRCVAHSSDANAITVQVYDETNGALIKDFDFGASSTVTAPGIALFSFELPTIARGAVADCVSFSVKIMGTAAGQQVFIHQTELLNNLLDNPSLDTGAVADPWIPYGWTNSGLDAGDSVIGATKHSTGASMNFTVGATLSPFETLYLYLASLLTNKFYSVGGWGYGDIASYAITSSGLVKYHYSTAAIAMSVTGGAAWQHIKAVTRIDGASGIRLGNNATDRFIDDLYIVALTDVSLTVTPASQANSLESGGIRVDGRDTLVPNPVISLPASAGKIRFRWIPRHSAADWYKFKDNADPRLVFCQDNSGNNALQLVAPSANTLRLYVSYGGVVVSIPWNATGAIVAGTTYLIEVWWSGGTVYVDVDSVNKITLAAGLFTSPITYVYYGSFVLNGQVDAVYLAP